MDWKFQPARMIDNDPYPKQKPLHKERLRFIRFNYCNVCYYFLRLFCLRCL